MGHHMRSYYMAISRLSLGVIILQAAVIIYFAASTDTINGKIEAGHCESEFPPGANPLSTAHVR